ncbi:MAG: CoA-binding protein [Candidatus Heimdallarchaeota archaeon]|nr:CoA-binding protein [Candidatus Heimdallarchaeota archaeon]
MVVLKEIEKIILTSKNIAVVGASRDPEKASYLIPKYLQEHGYKIIPVNPKADEILGEKAYSSLIEIKERVDIVDIFRPSEYTPKIVEEAIKIKPNLIWLQLGIQNIEAMEIANKNNIPIVMNKCLKIEHTTIMKNIEMK